MKRPQIALYTLLLLGWLFLACGTPVAPAAPVATSPAAAPTQPASTTAPSNDAAPPSSPILVGVEYILLDQAPRVARQAAALAPVGFGAAKHYAEHVEWGVMQPAPEAAINFARLDNFVSSFQAQGFAELVITLKSHSSWASVDARPLLGRDASPKPEHMAAYASWISQVVERYDGDGHEDMAGLQYPVRYYEIGSEFSSYEPEPVADYLAMLAEAYQAAHAVYADVRIAHAAFLTTLAFQNNPAPADYESAFTAIPDKTHGLADMRAVLDRPDLFDLLNLHALARPAEIEAMLSWLHYETGQRGYSKPVIISDTAPNLLVGWGAATVCDRPAGRMGVMLPPATEADRCDLAALFNNLIDRDEAALTWAWRFAAEDMVKKVVIAADQGVALINTAFSEDLYWQQIRPFQAGAGLSAWAGMLDLTLTRPRPSFYALQQLNRQLSDYPTVNRLPTDDPDVWLYELCTEGACRWLIWYEPDQVQLPGSPALSHSYSFTAPADRLISEPLALGGPATVSTSELPATNGSITLTLTTTPQYLYPR